MKLKSKKTHRARIDKNKRIVLSSDLVSLYDMEPDIQVEVEEQNAGLHVSYPRRLLKLYIEPTNKCNLGCKTCIRRTWDEPMGMMSESIFQRILDGLKELSHKPTIFFGGFGEPLYHPKIIEMINKVKELGSRVELITNGTLLTDEMSRELIKTGIDVLWVSIDGASPESYADIRLGATLREVIENIIGFSNILNNEILINNCGAVPSASTELGVAFVAMKRNIADLPAVLKLAHSFGANHFLVTNVLPYTKEMCEEILYKNKLVEDPYKELKPRVQLPFMDVMESTEKPLMSLMNYGENLIWAGINLISGKNRCPFIENGVGAIVWDGGFSPCLSLMHDHISYYQGRDRISRKWIIGNVMNRSLLELWKDPEHIDFRERVHKFDFAPCVYCGGCELARNNEEDCEGNTFPTCGGCLWAQGVIQCP